MIKYQYKKTNLGLTNDIYIRNYNNFKLVIRKVAKDIDEYLDNNYEKQILDIIKPYNLDVKLLSYDLKTKTKITYYINNYYLLDNCPYKDKYIRVAKILKQLHSIKPNIEHYFDPIKLINKYYNSCQKLIYNVDEYLYIINDIKDIYNPSCLCHNDIVNGNILFTKYKDYLIDYEFSAINDPLFDIMSFFTENNIYDQNIKEQFYKEYFNEIPPKEILDKLYKYQNFHNLLWYFWANMMYYNRNESVIKL